MAALKNEFRSRIKRNVREKLSRVKGKAGQASCEFSVLSGKANAVEDEKRP